MKDIAKLLNIDRSSVTKALNGDPNMSPKTIERVRKAAEQLGYRKDLIASSLQTGKNAVFGLILADFRRGIYAPLVESFQRYSIEHQYNTVLYYVNPNHDDLEHVIHLMQQQRVSGATFISAAATAKLHDHLSDLLERGIAVNTLDRDILGQQIDRVVFDHQKAGRDLTEHLISLGHRKIVFITYKGIKGTPAGRLKGYQEAMHEANLQEIIVTEDKPVAQTAGDEMMLSYHRIHQVWNQLDEPTAVIGTNDNFALGAFHALRERGYDIPNDISIAGFDDLSATMVVPQLTSMRSPMSQSGKKLAELLLQRAQGKNEPAKTFTLNYELIKRGTTAPARTTERFMSRAD